MPLNLNDVCLNSDPIPEGNEIMLRISHFKKVQQGKTPDKTFSPTSQINEFTSDEQIKPFLNRTSDFKVPMCQAFDVISSPIDTLESEK